MKYAALFLILLSLVNSDLYAQEYYVVQQPVVVYEQPRVVMVIAPAPVVTYVPTGYWIRERCWPFCFERWRYVPYNY